MPVPIVAGKTSTEPKNTSAYLTRTGTFTHTETGETGESGAQAKLFQEESGEDSGFRREGVRRRPRTGFKELGEREKV